MEEIKISNLSFRYEGGKSAALSDISLTVERGDFVTIAGHSGSGKTTLLRMLKPSLAPMGYMSGTVTLDGAEDSGAMDKTCAYITQSPEDGFVSDRVYGEIVFAAENMGMDEIKMHRRVSEIVSYFGLEELFSSDINSLSGGQAQLVGICAALITQP